MHGKKEQEEYIRKGPSEAEEDEVHEPREEVCSQRLELHSIQRSSSKSKSCHLRCVNKLRPNLKK